MTPKIKVGERAAGKRKDYNLKHLSDIVTAGLIEIVTNTSQILINKELGRNITGFENHCRYIFILEIAHILHRYILVNDK